MRHTATSKWMVAVNDERIRSLRQKALTAATDWR